MITINDGLIWFCKEGLQGCDTIPVDYAYIIFWILLIVFVVGIALGSIRRRR